MDTKIGRASIKRKQHLPGGVLPILGASPDGDAVCEGNGLGIGAVARTGGCVAFQYA